MALVREGIDISLWSKSLTPYLLTKKQRKSFLQLHSRLMGKWDFRFLPLLLFSLYLFTCWDRYAGQMLRVMWCFAHSSSSLSFPCWERMPRSWNVIPRLFGFVLNQKTLCLDAAGSVFARLHVQQTVQQKATCSYSVLSEVFWLRDGGSQEGLCFLLHRPNDKPQYESRHQLRHELCFHQQPPPNSDPYKGNISITSKSWFTSTSSICLLCDPYNLLLQADHLW